MGFEPNPKHAARLKEIERAYTACGWRTRFFTETAVSDYSGTTELFPDTKSDPKFKVHFRYQYNVTHQIRPKVLYRGEQKGM